MALMCRQIIGSWASCAGWVGLIVATATSDWVRSCDYTLATCVRLDELVAKGLWAECVISPALYHCAAHDQILALPAYIQTSRALMVCACLLGLPAMALVLMVMPCIRLQNDSSAIRRRRARAGGLLFICMALCGLISTVWFPIGVHKDEGLMSFGFSLYAGWVGTALCLLSGIIILFCRFLSPGNPRRENSFYFSRQASTAAPLDPPANHAKSARV